MIPRQPNVGTGSLIGHLTDAIKATYRLSKRQLARMPRDYFSSWNGAAPSCKMQVQEYAGCFERRTVLTFGPLSFTIALQRFPASRSLLLELNTEAITWWLQVAQGSGSTSFYVSLRRRRWRKDTR